jgi:PAS domain S-box-containing protein
MAWGTGAGSKACTRCKDEGYESVALVQLRSGVEVLGLLQFNSKQKGRFDAQLIAFLEDAADQLAVAAAHLKAVEALRKSETRLLKAQSMASVGNWEIKLKTGEVWASEEARRIYNFSMGERLTLESVRSAPLPEYREKLDLAMSKLAEGKGDYDLEFEIKQANSGSVVWVRSQAELVLDENGEPLAAGVIRDITAEKKAEEELRARETKFSEFFRNMISGAAMYKAVEGGEDFVFADINPAGEIISRVKREAVLGRRLLEIFPEAEKIGFLGLLREVWRTGRPAYLPERLYQDGRLSQWVENRIIKLPSGEVVAIYDDITQRRAAQDSIKASLAEKEVLLKEIHHRVKNNLQVVSSLLNLQAKTMKNAAAAAAFRESRSRVHAMALVHETLYRSHDLATLDMREYIGKLLDSLRGSCSAGSAVSFEKDIKSCSLCVDTAVCIGLILNELVSNSLKHAFADGRSGTIKVTLAGEKDGYRLEVADDGPGLPADYDLKRAESLGMQLVASLARQISGTVEAAPGAGSRFVLRFRG